MKRIFTAFLCCILICLQIIPCFAAASGMQTEKNEDGSFFIISDEPLDSSVSNPDLEDQIAPGAPGNNDDIQIEGEVVQNGIVDSAVGNMNSLIKLLKKIINALLGIIGRMPNQKEVTKTASNTKYIYYYSADSELLWHAQLTGEFAYTSTSVWCTNAAFDFRSLDSNWKLDDYTCKEQNATAAVTFSVVQKSLGVKLQTITKTLTLTCDTNGKVT